MTKSHVTKDKNQVRERNENENMCNVQFTTKTEAKLYIYKSAFEYTIYEHNSF